MSGLPQDPKIAALVRRYGSRRRVVELYWLGELGTEECLHIEAHENVFFLHAVATAMLARATGKTVAGV